VVGDTALTGVLALLLAHNLFIDRLPAWAYVPVCVTTAGAVVAISGVSAAGLGLSPTEPGVAVLGAAAAIMVVGLATRVPVTRALFHDDRLTGSVAYVALVRIPFGTVVLEEVAFRGVLLESTGPLVASCLFGLWHLVPTNTALDMNGVATSPRARMAALAIAAVATAMAGAGLAWLRLATGSLFAPAMVHAAATASAAVAAYAVTRPPRADPRAPAGERAPGGSSRRSRRRGRRASRPGR
jgi:membrane protease YdiL (CAAX protease family)